jgi:RHH-type transcriptional regulator, proline utilization regulon repressor / proline dehydrogenase / delta 1-pyrroline-5-carboxylate dehydrogenase
MRYFDEQLLIRKAIELAEFWQLRADDLLTKEERGIQRQMKRLLNNPLDKIILTRLIDESFRSHNNSRVAEQVNAILGRFGAPDFFSQVEKVLIQMFQGLGRYFPDLLVPRMVEKMREASSRAIIPGELNELHAHLLKRKSQGIRMNINHLGEAVLGEEEAKIRLATYIRDLTDLHIECISVKISTLYSQINSLAFSHSVEMIKQRLSELYRVAKETFFVRSDGTRVPKFVNLDMEEYRDLAITYHAFIQTLDQPEFNSYSAGIVLQAYLPDSHSIQQELTEWAKKRVAGGGAPVKLRIVKGANMEMEKLESALFNWPLAPYDTKLEVDANYKRMVFYGMKPVNIQAVNLGIASHNLFDLAYAECLGEQYQVERHFCFEMLEGMADHIRRAIAETAGDVLLYAPVASKEEFINAIAYLIRRLDENTASGNFLRYAPELSVGSENWELLKNDFISSCAFKDKAKLGPRRVQNRDSGAGIEKFGTFYQNAFFNEPDTDWSLPANRAWAATIRNRWKKSREDILIEVPIVAGGEDIRDNREIRRSLDPNQFADGIIIAHVSQATPADIETAIATARSDPDGWRIKSPTERHEILSRVATALRAARGDLIGAAAADTGKPFAESDVEVSEAIDFAEYYPYSAKTFFSIDTVAARGRGVGLVISPWNFPIAIPCGGIIAALAAGNTVIIKPSSEASLTAWELCKCFWRTGVSKNTLQFLPCSGSMAGLNLTAHPGIDFVILTGGTNTGLQILQQCPGVYLAAETGGKNATIVTEMADRDQAVKNVIHSAFSNGGQKCSATSLLILEKPVYEDEHFIRQLVDAARSIHVGSAWEYHNRLTPLIHPPTADLFRGLTALEPGETWVLQPMPMKENPHIWTPGIKYGVQPGSFTHRTELFGPVLGVMCASDLNEAIDWVNATGYGLTSGLESLDHRDQALWREQIRAGNLYINRGTTGAITLRQPFGGMGKSALGPGIKAGGPDYVSQFMQFKDTSYPITGPIRNDTKLLKIADTWRLNLRWGDMAPYREDILRTVHAIRSYHFHWENWFATEWDFFHLRGQDNIFRYRPVGKVAIRLHPKDSLYDILARISASCITGCKATVSIPIGMPHSISSFLDSNEGKNFTSGVEILSQTEGELIDMIPLIDRIRYAAQDRVSPEVLSAAAKTGFFISRVPVLMDGRIELLQYMRQQVICSNYHRYGNIGERGLVH